MSKRMKKLIGILLSASMMISSAGMVAFADEADTAAGGDAQATATAAPDAEETVAPDAEATDAPDTEAAGDTGSEITATEVPDAEDTAEPTAAPAGKYESDVPYQRALTLVTTLGIFEGDETGEMNAESNVKRSEMSAIVLRMLNTQAVGPYQNGFNDVTDQHWAANEIQTAQSLGIINGFEDGSFRPDGDVTYEQVLKMIVCALGYDAQAKFAGGYPNGYLSQASTLELMDNAYGVLGEPADRGLVIKIVYNALLARYNELVSKDAYGQDVRNATQTLAKAKFNVNDANGVLTATPSKTISESYSDLQSGLVVIDNVTYLTELTGLDEYVGTEITYFYRDTYGQVTPTLVAVTTKNSSKTEKVTINIDNVNRLTGFENGTGVIEMDRGSNYRCPDATINYNGVVITAAEYDRISSDKTNQDKFLPRDYKGEVTSNTVMSFNEFLLPKNGTFEITDLDGDGKYDYVFIESYETMLVTTSSSKTLSGKINNSDRSFRVDTEENQDLKLTVLKGGEEVRARNLNPDDVVSVMESLDGNTLKFVSTGESITGTVSTTGLVDNEFTATIDGTRYVVDANAIERISSGSEGTFYLDMFNRIGYATSSGGGRLSGSEKYGWLMNAYLDDDGSTYKVKVYSQEGKAEVYEMASAVNYWAYDASAPTQLTGSQRNDIVNAVKNGSFLSASGIGSPIRLCKYRVGSTGTLNTLYMATEAKTNSPSSAVIVDPTNLRNVGSVGVTVGGHTVSDGIMGFSVPKNPSDMNTDTEFSTFSVTASSYAAVLGVQRDFVLGEFTNDRDSNILIEFTASGSAKAEVTDYGTVDDNPCMVVTGVDLGVDEYGDTVYYIVGRRNGAEVSYATTQNTTLLKSTDAFLSGSGSTASYPTKELWNAVDDKDSIENYLTPGDVLGVKADASGARILIKFVDVKELANKAMGIEGAEQYMGYNSASETRDGYGLGAVADVDTSGDTYFSMVDQSGATLSHSWYFPSATAIDLVEVTTDENGFVSSKVDKQSYEPAEMMNYNVRNKIGDFVFSRNFRNNAQREAFVFRFNDN